MKFLKEEFMEMAKSLYYEVFRGFQSISLLHKTQFPWAFFFFFWHYAFNFLFLVLIKKESKSYSTSTGLLQFLLCQNFMIGSL